MRLIIKLYAGLSDYLPAHAENHQFVLNVSEGITANAVIDQCRVPREMAHLVLLNGVYVKPEERDHHLFHDGDTLALWPPVMGG